jgi:hypothetical protein
MANGRIECLPGQAITSIQKGAGQDGFYTYDCAVVPSIGACGVVSSDQVDTNDENDLWLRHLQAKCGQNSALQAIIAEHSSGGNWIRFRYTCCGSVGLPVSVEPVRGTGAALHRAKLQQNFFQEHEGIYCPTSRDESGRPGFVMEQSVKNPDTPQAQLTLRLAYERAMARWCVAEEANQVAPKWNVDDKMCMNSDVPHPLDAELGTDIQVMALSDFNGIFEAKGVPKVAAGAPPKPERKRPKLIEFGAVHPEYKRECMDDVMPGTNEFSKDKMNEIGMGIWNEGKGPGAQNPCAMVAGFNPPKGTGEEPGGLWYTKGEPDTTDATQVGSVFAGLGSKAIIYKPDVPDKGLTYWDIKDRGRRGNQVHSQKHFADDWNKGFRLIKDNIRAALDVPVSMTPSNWFGFGAGIGAFSVTGFSGFPINPVTLAKKIHLGFMFATTANSIVDLANSGEVMKKDEFDLGMPASAFLRLGCDLHCIRDLIKENDKAIQGSLKNAHQAMSTNMDRLFDYYIGTVHDSLDLMKEQMEKTQDVVEDVHSATAGPVPALVEVQRQLHGMFLEMDNMLGRNLYGHAKTTAVRALDSYASTFAQLGRLNLTSASGLVTRITSDTSMLKSTITVASSKELSNVEEVSMRTASSVREQNAEMQQELFVLGVYTDSARQKKEDQRKWFSTQQVVLADVIDEVWKASANMLLVEIDQSWWASRTKLDDYFEACNRQEQAFRGAVTTLNEYTSKCTTTFPVLKLAYARALKAQRETHNQLRDTWHAVENELGLLASKLVDTQGFHQLLRLDASSVNLTSKQSQICSGDLKGAVAAVNATFIGGFADQTWEQLAGVVMEMQFLMSRFRASGLKPPSGRALGQGWQRVITAYLGAKDRYGDIALEKAERFRESNCQSGVKRESESMRVLSSDANAHAQIISAHNEFGNDLAQLETQLPEQAVVAVDENKKKLIRSEQGVAKEIQAMTAKFEAMEKLMQDKESQNSLKESRQEVLQNSLKESQLVLQVALVALLLISLAVLFMQSKSHGQGGA